LFAVSRQALKAFGFGIMMAGIEQLQPLSQVDPLVALRYEQDSGFGIQDSEKPLATGPVRINERDTEGQR
jgi:hypothetical protein